MQDLLVIFGSRLFTIVREQRSGVGAKRRPSLFDESSNQASILDMGKRRAGA